MKREILVDKRNGDFKTINEAIRFAEPKDRIIINGGFYDEKLVIDKEIELVGKGNLAYQLPVIQQEEGTILEVRANAVIKNLIFKNGKELEKGPEIVRSANWEAKPILWESLLLIRDKAAIENCVFENAEKAGLELYGEKAELDIRESTFAGNYIGLIAAKCKNLLIKNCDFYQNNNSGCELYEIKKGEMRDCELYKNYFGIKSSQTNKNFKIVGCDIYENVVSGIEFESNTMGRVEGCFIIKNRFDGVHVASWEDDEMENILGEEEFKKNEILISRCYIDGNFRFGIYVEGQGNPKLKDCDFQANRKGNIELYEYIV